MNFSSDAMADFEGLLEVNRKICKQQMAEKASPTLPTNCAVLPPFFAGGFVRIFAKIQRFPRGKTMRSLWNSRKESVQLLYKLDEKKRNFAEKGIDGGRAMVLL